MDTINGMKETRRKHLAALLASRFKGDRAQLCAAAGITKGRLSQLLDESEPFGDVAANNLAEALQLPAGYFDRPLAGLLGPIPGSEGYEDKRPPMGLFAPPMESVPVLGLSQEAYNLGRLYDQIPAADIVRRARAQQSAQQAILAVLLEKQSSFS